MKTLAILISNIGTGTNLQAIIDAIESKKLNSQITVVISDTKETPGLKRAKKHKIKIAISPEKENLLLLLKKYEPDYIVLAGWKQIVTNDVIDAYKNKILNLHPGAVPDTKDGKVKNPDGTTALWNRGKLAEKAVQNFLDQKATYAGSSVHFLTHDFDFGPVLERGFVKIKKGDTVESLYSRLKEKEHEIYINALKTLCATTVMVIDGGGRGAALIDAYDKSKYVDKLFAIPGNDLMEINVTKPLKIFPNLKTTSVKEIIEICKNEKVTLVDVNQDNAVAAGLVDALKEARIQAIGPTQKAGQIEWDKSWSRNFMVRHRIPHPSFKVFDSTKKGTDFIKLQKEGAWFIKASGLAGGYGVLPASNNSEALERIQELSQRFGNAARTYLIEEWLVGEEFSSYAICDGEHFKILGHAQDNKRLEDGDKGPNTGGIGSTSPPLVVTKGVIKQIEKIFEKTIHGLKIERRPYVGILYLGAMLVGKKVYVIEFNSRWGDPEVEVILPSIKNDIFELSNLALSGNVKNASIKHDNKYRLLVTACAKGYPFDLSNSLGKQISGIKETSKLKGIKIYGSGVKQKNGKYFTSGGRLFHIVAEGNNVLDARKIAYNALSKIRVEGNNLHYRTDIGFRDVNRMK